MLPDPRLESRSRTRILGTKDVLAWVQYPDKFGADEGRPINCMLPKLHYLYAQAITRPLLHALLQQYPCCFHVYTNSMMLTCYLWYSKAFSPRLLGLWTVSAKMQ
jgi:hypothetical protein